MEKIIENNKLIAEFMGGLYNNQARLSLQSNEIWLPYHGVCNYKSDNGKSLKYHSDWNWLMEVVFKCLEICRNEKLNEWENGFSDSFFSRDINCMYSEVFKFIEWYNNKPLDNHDEVKNNSTKRDRVLKAIMERYEGLCNLKSAMREDEDVVLVNLCDDLNDEFSELELLEIIKHLI